MDIATLRGQWEQAGQGQVFRFFDSLDDVGQEKLAAQLDEFDPRHLNELAEQYVRRKPDVALPKEIRPVDAFPREPRPDQRALYDDARKRGEALLAAGKVAAFLVAGGQGTRLGYDGPKGEFPVTPVRHKPLFQVFAEQIRAYARDFKHVVPWYIMTSDTNDAPTRAFFKQHNYFGLEPRDVFFFRQGMMPAFSMDGKLLLAEKDSLALSPDGHGGSLRALHRSGALSDMRNRGVEHLSFFQVDNPLVHVIDPLFLGLHDLTGSEMSSKTIPKAGPL
jgi:UDP-N-acetylglucosamine/UDP-N-acetylgalactosamine diphosphorylase